MTEVKSTEQVTKNAIQEELNNFTFLLPVPGKEINSLLSLLGELPYGKVSGLIVSIQKVCSDQFAEHQKKKEEGKEELEDDAKKEVIEEEFVESN